MKCKDFEKLVPRLTHNQLLDAGTREQGVAHKEGCAPCAQRLAEEQFLLAGVCAVVAEISREEAPASVEAALLAAFRKQKTASISASGLTLPVKTSPRAPHWKRAAIAAGIFILFSLGIFFWQQARALNQRSGEQVKTSAPTLAPEPLPPAPQAVVENRAVTSQAATRPQPKRLRPQPFANRKSEVLTEFFPLMEGEELDGLENGQIVRVELSGAALLEVGLPVDVAMANESVKADVVLGHDGLARAIRFVRQ